MRFITLLGLASAGALLWTGCDSPPAGELTSPESVETGPLSTAMFPSALEQRLGALTQAVAVSLRTGPVRKAAFGLVNASANHEGKLLFRDFLERMPDRFGTDIESTLGVEISEALVQLPELEIYLPVEKHRSSWRGGADVLLATSRSDGDEIAAFDLDGDFVALSKDSPPETPVIALVRAEGRPQPVDSETLSSSQHSILERTDLYASSAAVTVDMVTSVIYNADDYDGWLSGAPEFEVHTFDYNSDHDSSYNFKSCSGQYASAPYFYNQNDGSWASRVRIADVNDYQGTGYRWQVWERDTADCDWPTSRGAPPETSDNSSEQLTYTGAAVAGLGLICGRAPDLTVAAICAGGILTAAALAYLISSDSGDRLVGEIVLSGRKDCWQDVTPPISLNIRNGSGTKTGEVGLEFSGVDYGPACPNGTINGPSSVSGSGPYEFWLSNLSGGGGPGTYSYQWYVQEDDGTTTTLGTNSNQWVTNSYSGFYFWVVVDITSAEATTTKYHKVFLDSGCGKELTC